VISFRFIRVPRSHSLRNRAQKRRWLLSANSLNSCFFCSSPPLYSTYKNRRKIALKWKKSIRKTIRLTLTRSDSLRTNAGSHGNLRSFLQRNLRRNGSAGWKLNSRHWSCLLFVCVKVEEEVLVFTALEFFQAGAQAKRRRDSYCSPNSRRCAHTEEKKKHQTKRILTSTLSCARSRYCTLVLLLVLVKIFSSNDSNRTETLLRRNYPRLCSHPSRKTRETN